MRLPRLLPLVVAGLDPAIHPPCKPLPKRMDARVKPGHDDLCAVTSDEHAHDVALLHDQECLAVELDLGARPFAKQHAVADLEVDRDQLAGFVTAARTYRGDLALRGLLLGAIRNDDAALGLLFGVDTFDHDAVMQWTKLGLSHDGSFGSSVLRVCSAIESGSEYGRIRHRQGAKTARILSNRALGVLIVRPGIWLDADPVKQRWLSLW